MLDENHADNGEVTSTFHVVQNIDGNKQKMFSKLIFFLWCK